MSEEEKAAGLAQEALRRALACIAEREARVNAWQWLDENEAWRAAREIDRSGPGGPLHGMLIGVKDIIDTHDMPTGLGFDPYADRRPAWDAGCVAACRDAGALVLGKTVSTEFAYFAAGKTRNPHDFAATPGGSSSGSAAAVAAGMVDAAFGSQTAGSLIRPAAYCGVVGYKGSHDAFGLSGIRPLAQSFDSLGIVAGSVEPVTRIRQVLNGEAVEPLTVPMRAPYLGLCRTRQWEFVEPAARQAVEEAARMLAAGGATVEAVQLPESFEQAFDCHGLVMAYEVARNYAFEYRHYTDRLSAAFNGLCEKGQGVSHASYRMAKETLRCLKAELGAHLAGFDAWIAPAALGEAPPAVEGTGSPLMCILWTALGAPCLGLPVGKGPRGLPLGIQLVAAPGEDAGLLAVGAWVEARLQRT
ncbi:amidase [Pigmentiphaga sp. GD03639]|uniref:amidase n=1 Tax=Pigmentiphaga sp. GD03639 TaxID=2975354 RepID=UPI00244B1890|nr:amidase [Pigmentiphaga sp. GD03639]MDH2236533.1 amidase [Pigmentiphaga sp. GD03639]